MSSPTSCWHCGQPTEEFGGMFWAVVRVTGYLDEYDVTLCGTCASALLIPQREGFDENVGKGPRRRRRVGRGDHSGGEVLPGRVPEIGRDV